MSGRKRLASVVFPLLAVLTGVSVAEGDPLDDPFGLGREPAAAVTPMPGSRPIYAEAGTMPPGVAVPGMPAQPGPASERPLMTLLGQTSVGDFLHRTGINIYGWVEGSYTKNFDTPPVAGRFGRLNLGRLFDIEDNDFLVNQLDLTVERKVDLASGRFEVGGRMDLLYGTDARFIHSNGMFDDVSYTNGPQYQFDIPQLYVDLGIPFGDGHALRVRLGKFEFFKPIDPNASAFYSHTFAFAAAGLVRPGASVSAPFLNRRVLTTALGEDLPFTLTGVSVAYSFGPRLNVEAGLSRGWNQSPEDNNSALNAFGRVIYGFSDRTKLSFAMISGPEIDLDNARYRTAADLSITRSLNDNLALLFDALYGIQARPGAFRNIFSGATSSGDAHWYGISGNIIYRINDHMSIAGRLEAYRDEQGFTTSLPQTLYEATVGVTISPFPDSPSGSGLKVRPELRYDYSDHRYFKEFTNHHQWTAAVDAIYNF